MNLLRSRYGERVPLLILLCMAIAGSGCNVPLSDEVTSMRAEWLVQKPPTGATPISEIKGRLASGELGAGSVVVVRARINAGEMSPWTRDQAAFVVTDATGHDGSEDHNPHQCPFCRRDIMDHIALVRCMAGDGQLVPMDARKLLGVAEGELLVVQGTICDTDTDELAIDAQRVHIVAMK
ncbi:MAG: hypothetical protein MK110_14710 [Fuerstiella sp.]|nr:hypothetical protein [Fuerstiella sp.]